MAITIVDAITNLVNHTVLRVVSEYRSHNRANGAGDALEEYVKDLFSGAFGMDYVDQMDCHSRAFSYLGNGSNPPDAMLWEGDAIEVKKLESRTASLALNSSYPKHSLRVDSPMISTACRDAEVWREKDMLYVVGFVHEGMLKDLAMVYGLDYCASAECYDRLKNVVSEGVNAIPGVNFSPTRELGRVNRVDPLGITSLRVRGMWGIENPWTVFDYVYRRDERQRFNFMALINKSKWESLGNADALYDLSTRNRRLHIKDVRIKDPDNPAHLNDAKLVTFTA